MGGLRDPATDALVLAIDVGSTSARAGVFDSHGAMLASASTPFAVHRPLPDHAEHDSEQIWNAVGTSVRAALAACPRSADTIAGVAFDATCSLVLLDADGAPVSVSAREDDHWNVVMWADHRAVQEAREISATGHRALDYVGGTMSPEMQLPKLLWLKRHRPAQWARYTHAMDLADFLTWKATGTVSVSACTVTCKWAYLNHEAVGWQQDLFDRIGLEDLQRKFALPATALPVGSRVGGLCAQTARNWGLRPGIAVATSMIDAHAGALGVLGATPSADLDDCLALIAGTSNCHMALSQDPRKVPGIWGPYFGALLPDGWLNEGGQSASGALLDHVLDTHACGAALGADRHFAIQQRIADQRRTQGAAYASDMLVVPDFHGNRSPLARPDVRGIVWGLDLDPSIDGLARLYHAAAVGIAYGTRHIIDALNQHGYRIRRLHLTGGHARSPLLVQLYANATGCEIVLPREADGVLLGTALLAATAAGIHGSLLSAGQAMVHDRAVVAPEPEATGVHQRGYAAFRLLQGQRQQVLDLLHAATSDPP
ncbi:MAG: FGGY-family carbohydrate kinase [Burkholderiaceae bacterium]